MSLVKAVLSFDRYASSSLDNKAKEVEGSIFKCGWCRKAGQYNLSIKWVRGLKDFYHFKFSLQFRRSRIRLKPLGSRGYNITSLKPVLYSSNVTILSLISVSSCTTACFLHLTWAFHWNVRWRCSRAFPDPRYHRWHLPSIFIVKKVWKSPQLTGVRQPDRLVNSKLGSSSAFLPFQSLSKKGAQWGVRHPLMDVLYRLSQTAQIPSLCSWKKMEFYILAESIYESMGIAYQLSSQRWYTSKVTCCVL